VLGFFVLFLVLLHRRLLHELRSNPAS